MGSEFLTNVGHGTPSFDDLGAELLKTGFDFVTAVPCGVQERLIRYLQSISNLPFILAAREDEAIGIAAGAAMACKKPLVLMQNSGFGNSVNAITSLVMAYRIPLVLLVTWRGSPGWPGEDVPYHAPLGSRMLALLDSLGIPHFVLESQNYPQAISEAARVSSREGAPAVLLLRRGMFL